MSRVIQVRIGALAACAVAALALGPAAVFASTTIHVGNITTGPQFDLYNLDLVSGTVVEARLVCDEIAPGDRPLDPVLSVFFPGSNSSDTIFADVFNDDGFGADDHPEGVDCNAFDSSRVFFRIPATGTYVFRADGFGSATGPYTLTIVNVPRVDLDFDGDNISDFGLFRRSSGALVTVNSTDDAVMQVCCASPSLGDVSIPGDYDGDMKTDRAVYRMSTRQFFILQSSDGALVQRSAPDSLPGDVPIPADYDGDTITDIAVYRPSTGAFIIVKSSDLNLTQACCASASLGDQPIPADYDGDGRADAAVFRTSNGSFLILRSSDLTITSVCCAAPSLGDTPVPGDYDGDLKTDVAVYRASTATFFVLRSSDGVLVSRTIGNPSAGDAPVIGDYDADGKADAAIYRPATGRFLVRRSSDDGLSEFGGLAPNVPGDAPLKR